MMIDGVWHDNFSCPTCRYRHPTHIPCAQAREHAAKLKAERDARIASMSPLPYDENADARRYRVMRWVALNVDTPLADELGEAMKAVMPEEYHEAPTAHMIDGALDAGYEWLVSRGVMP